MFAPKLFRVNKIPLKHIVDNAYNIHVEREENNKFSVLQQNNMLFRQIRLLTGDDSGIYIPYCIFVDCNVGKNNKEALTAIITNGFCFNGRHYVI